MFSVHLQPEYLNVFGSLCSLICTTFSGSLSIAECCFCLCFLHRKLIFEVWDRDNVWNDDLLGRVAVIPTVGHNINKRFGLKHGTLHVRLSAACAPSLKGSLCEQYAASPSSDDEMGYMEEDREEHWGSGWLGQEGDGAHRRSVL